MKVGIAISLFSLLEAQYTGYDMHFMGEQTEDFVPLSSRKVTASYWSGLSHCYDIPDLPRTNNE